MKIKVFGPITAPTSASIREEVEETLAEVENYLTENIKCNFQGLKIYMRRIEEKATCERKQHCQTKKRPRKHFLSRYIINGGEEYDASQQRSSRYSSD